MFGKIFLGLASVSITLNSQLPKTNAELIIVEEGPWHGKCSAIGIHANQFTKKVSNFICAAEDLSPYLLITVPMSVLSSRQQKIVLKYYKSCISQSLE